MVAHVAYCVTKLLQQSQGDQDALASIAGYPSTAINIAQSSMLPLGVRLCTLLLSPADMILVHRPRTSVEAWTKEEVSCLICCCVSETVRRWCSG